MSLEDPESSEQDFLRTVREALANYDAAIALHPEARRERTDCSCEFCTGLRLLRAILAEPQP
jgi:hypothetical protein